MNCGNVHGLQITSSKTNDECFIALSRQFSVFLGIGCIYMYMYMYMYMYIYCSLSHSCTCIYVYMYSLTCVIIQLGYMWILGSN